MYGINEVGSVLEGAAFAAIGNDFSETWFAVHTNSRHEKVVAQEARDLGITTFPAVVKEVPAMVGPAESC